MVFFAGKLIDGIEYDMGVDVFPIRVDTDDGLIPRQVFPHKFLRDLQCQFRRDLAGAKGLNDVVKLHTVRFIPALFDRGHVMAGRCRETPLRRCEDLPFRLISVENIRNGLG